MASIRNLLLLALPLASLVLSQANPQQSQSRSREASDKEGFRELLNALPEESLHAALDNHMRPKYQEGVFENHKHALEKVHDGDPLFASKLVQWAAVRELRKRQAPSNSSSATSSSESSSAPPSTSVTTTTVTSDSTTVVTETSTPLPSSTPPDVIPSSTPTPTPSPTPTDNDNSSPAPPPASTMATSRSRSLVLITTTLTDGHVKTITSYTYVGPTPAETENTGPSATKGSPSLQSGAANVLSRRWGVEAAALVGGAVGVAWIL